MELDVPRDRLFAAVRAVADALVTGKDDRLLTDAMGRRVHLEDLQRVLHDYAAELVPLPDEAIDALDAGRITGVDEGWWVTQDLWSTEGRTDLQLRAEAERTGVNLVVRVDDLLVP